MAITKETKTVYICSDGEEFETEACAEAHESRIEIAGEIGNLFDNEFTGMNHNKLDSTECMRIGMFIAENATFFEEVLSRRK